MTPDQQTAFNNALYDGISRKDMDMIKLALDRGANPNLLLFAAIDYKKTMGDRFHAAAGYRHNVASWFKNGFHDMLHEEREVTFKEYGVADMRLDWARTAFAAGADANATRDWQDRPWGAAHWLHSTFDKGLMDCLIENGFKVDTPDPNNNTLLMKAVTDKKPELVEYYLSKWADPMQPCGENNDTFPLQALEQSDGFKKSVKAKLLTEMMRHVKKPKAAPAPVVQPATPPPPPAPVEPENNVVAPEKASFAKTEHHAQAQEKVQQPKHGFAL